MLDLALRGGTLIDGTGASGRAGDLGVRSGRIVALGDVPERARREIDARGRVVAPGFVDLHTHYDAQVFWDPTLTPSSAHGVTSVVGGNCGFSIAPLRPEASDYLARMLARVEGMPLESLRAGVPWDWRSFGDYLERLEGRLAVNAGFLVGHSALRRVAMGERAVGGQAGESDLLRMAALLRESLAAGGLGFSSSRAPTHVDADGEPVPSRAASRDEILALCRVAGEFPGTALEFVPPVDPFPEELVDLMISMSLAAGRPLNWNVLNVSSETPQLHEGQLAASDAAAARGARIVALTLPQVVSVRINLRTGFLFDALPGWAEVMALPLEQRAAALADPGVRARLDAGARSDEAGVLRNITRWDRMRIAEAFAPENRAISGRRVGEIARERGVAPLDALFDLALADGLRTVFLPELPGQDDASWALRGRVWNDPRTLVGASDAGAHLDMIDTFAFATALLGDGVRERGLISLEAAVRELTDAPARLYGLRGRGRLEAGWIADLVVFDPETVGPGPVHTRFDLPAGAARLYAEARGVDRVFVAGVEVFAGGEPTGARPGVVLRSGRDTETVKP